MHFNAPNEFSALLSARCHRFLSSRPRLSILFRKTTQASTPSFPNFSADSLRQFSTFNGHIVSWSHLLISFPRSNSCQQVLSQATPSSETFSLPLSRPNSHLPISVPEIYSLPKKVLMRAALGLSPFPAPLPGHSIIDPAGTDDKKSLLFMRLLGLSRGLSLPPAYSFPYSPSNYPCFEVKD